MKAKHGSRVLHLVRSVGPTSMPWNDLYGTARKLSPGLMYPPVAVGMKPTAIKWELCSGRRRRYLQTGPFKALGQVLHFAAMEERWGRPLVVHVHNPILAAILLAAKVARPNIKIVTTQHNEWRFFRPHQQLGLRVLARIGDHYACCGKAVAESVPVAVRTRLTRTGRLSAVPNGIDPCQLEKYAREPVPVGGAAGREREVTAVVVARLVPQKNCMFVLQLLKEASSIDRLIWFGDGPQRNEIAAEIERLGLRDRIELRGRRPRIEVLTTLSQSTLYIAASKWEGLSVADLEATALGCWPIMSNIVQRKEIAEALDIPLYPLSDIGAWIEGIEAFVNHPLSVCQEMRDRIASRTKVNFDLNTTVAQYIEIYRSVSSGSVDLRLAGEVHS